MEEEIFMPDEDDWFWQAAGKIALFPKKNREEWVTCTVFPSTSLTNGLSLNPPQTSQASAVEGSSTSHDGDAEMTESLDGRDASRPGSSTEADETPSTSNMDQSSAHDPTSDTGEERENAPETIEMSELERSQSGVKRHAADTGMLYFPGGNYDRADILKKQKLVDDDYQYERLNKQISLVPKKRSCNCVDPSIPRTSTPPSKHRSSECASCILSRKAKARTRSSRRLRYQQQ